MVKHRELSFEDYAAMFRRRRWLILIPALLGAVAGYALSRYLPKKYTSHTLILVEQPTVPDSYVKPVVSEDLNQRLPSIQKQMQSRYVGELPEDDKTNLTLLAGMTPQLEAATQALNQAQQDKAFTESLLNQQLAAWQSSKGGQNSQTLEQQLQDLQNQLLSEQGHYTEDYPDVVKLKNDIALVQKKLADVSTRVHAQPNEPQLRVAGNEPPEIQQFRARLHQIDLTIRQKAHEQEELQRQIKLLQSRIQSSPMIQQQFKALTRDYQTALSFYNDLLKKRNESQMATELERHQQGEQFRVLDPPSLPERPSFPKPPLFGLGGLGAGLVLGLVLVRFTEWRDKSIRTKRDIEIYLGVPTLALLPSMGPARKEKNGNRYRKAGAAIKRRAFSLHVSS